MAGASENVVFHGNNLDYVPSLPNYAVGILDEHSDTLKLFATPLIRLDSTPASLINASVGQGNAVKDQEMYRQARTELGDTFGNKRRKTQLRTEERGKIDAALLKSSQAAIMSNIKQTTQHMPTKEEQQMRLDEARPVPPYNLDAVVLEEVYPLSGIFEDSILRAVDTDKFFAMDKDIEERIALLPFQYLFQFVE